jgi:hypothetical protein
LGGGVSSLAAWSSQMQRRHGDEGERHRTSALFDFSFQQKNPCRLISVFTVPGSLVSGAPTSVRQSLNGFTAGVGCKPIEVVYQRRNVPTGSSFA